MGTPALTIILCCDWFVYLVHSVCVTTLEYEAPEERYIPSCETDTCSVIVLQDFRIGKPGKVGGGRTAGPRASLGP